MPSSLATNRLLGTEMPAESTSALRAATAAELKSFPCSNAARWISAITVALLWQWAGRLETGLRVVSAVPSPPALGHHYPAEVLRWRRLE